ncbi:Glutathione S-transferase Mu 4, partial [Cichlidogyrus casuarinus]
LPYFIDGDFKLTETLAIIMYIAEKNGKGGCSIEERAILRMVYGRINDIRTGLVRICYSKDFDSLKPGYLESLPKSLSELAAYLEKHKWFSGKQPDYPDFNAYDLFDTLITFQHGCLNDYPKILEFMENFKVLPGVKEYLLSSSYMKWPFNNKIAMWGGDSE